MRNLIRFLLACTAALPCPPAHAQPSTTVAVLYGRVLDANDKPVASAHVSIEGIASALTDSLGRFAFAGLETETLLIRVQRLGYGLATRAVMFSDTASMDVIIKLGARATMLSGVMVMDSVEADSRNYARRRLTAPGGFFMTETDLAKRRFTQRVENILATVPGITVEMGIVKVQRGRISILGNNCENGVQYFIDGAKADFTFTPRALSSVMLKGVEVYKTAASTPQEYRTERSVCGTVVLWTY